MSITKQLSTQNALEFISSFSTNNYYAFLGRKNPWTNDLVPPDSTENISFLELTRANILALKKITVSDVCLGVTRINWTTDTVYNQFSDSTSNFYVLTDDFNVYKCISNNSGGLSTVKPSGTSTSQFTTGDGYIWKFLYNLSVGVQSKFLKENFLPVPTGNQRTQFQLDVETASSWSTGQSPEGNGSFAAYELGANLVSASQAFVGDEYSFTVGDDFRQIGLIVNPKLPNGSLATALGYDTDGTSSINLNSGQILYIENITPIVRNSSQTDTIQLVFSL